MAKQAPTLIWIDLEMTGLDPNADRIIEIATIVTTDELDIIAEGPSLVVNQAQALLDGMDSWNTRHHTDSGLLAKVQSSEITDEMAEIDTIKFLEKHVKKGSSPMCGNTISQDRRFLANYMPKLEKFFHYRQIDVSSIKELAKRWQPGIARGYNKTSQHLALSDIKDSIEELQYYKKHFFINSTLT